MDKNKLLEVKKRLLALGLAGVMIGTTGCSDNKDNKVESRYPGYTTVPSGCSNIDNYYKYAIQNGEATKLYNSSNVYLLFNKETYEVNEYIYYSSDTMLGLGTHAELYDLPSEEMLFYSSGGISTAINKNYYNYLLENNYQICLTDVSDYVEEYTCKEYCSLDEIRELEPQIAEGLKKINFAKVNTK